MEDIKSVIAKNITQLRQAAGMTQSELGEKLNYSDKSVSKWERAESIPDVAVLKQLADLFGVKLDDLLREEPE
ncbi:MAG: helix-turn-helix transcriptional regulator, partial [Oscillospiraceae bacterium]|nr:helix-turn-helix transcriptional regulator [Oscillospiraceae bacterium]